MPLSSPRSLHRDAGRCQVQWLRGALGLLRETNLDGRNFRAIGIYHASHDGDRGRVPALPEVDPNHVARRHYGAGEPLIVPEPTGALYSAVRGLPHRNGERQDQIIVFSRSGVEGQVSRCGKFAAKILQLD